MSEVFTKLSILNETARKTLPWKDINNLPKDVDFFIGYIPEYKNSEEKIMTVCVCKKQNDGFFNKHNKVNPTKYLDLYEIDDIIQGVINMGNING